MAMVKVSMAINLYRMLTSIYKVNTSTSFLSVYLKYFIERSIYFHYLVPFIAVFQLFPIFNLQYSESSSLYQYKFSSVFVFFILLRSFREIKKYLPMLSSFLSVPLSNFHIRKFFQAFYIISCMLSPSWFFFYFQPFSWAYFGVIALVST